MASATWHGSLPRQDLSRWRRIWYPEPAVQTVPGKLTPHLLAFRHNNLLRICALVLHSWRNIPALIPARFRQLDLGGADGGVLNLRPHCRACTTPSFSTGQRPWMDWRMFMLQF